MNLTVSNRALSRPTGNAAAVMVLVIQALLACGGFGAGKEVSGGPVNPLPWELIAERVNDGERFFENRDLSGASKLTGVSERTVKASLAKWAGDSWEPLGEVSAVVGRDAVVIVDGIKEGGFFRLRFCPGAVNGGLSNSEAYVVWRAEWKEDILAFCRRMKEAIESERDSKLIFSSIAISHFDHTMEIISAASSLSGKVLGALGEAVASKAAFEAGECPEPVIGLNKIQLQRFEGAKLTEFVVFIPEGYDSAKSWPVLLTVDARRREARLNYPERSGLIDVWWHFSGYHGFEWKDYEYLLGLLKRKLNVDEDRIYVYGMCANGIGAMALALNHPDEWAECVSVLGSSYRHLAGNALNLPLIYIQGLHDQDADRLASYKFVVNSFLYRGCRHFKHSRSQELEEKVIEELRGRAVPDAFREKKPQRVYYRIDSLQSPKAYWVRILGREDENFVGTIDVSVEGQKVFVKTTNIVAYCLDLVQAPLDSNKPVEIVENGKNLGNMKGEVFTRKPEAYAKATYLKNERLQGPIWDAFSDPYVIVYGTAGSDEEYELAGESLARRLSRGAPCFSDVDLPAGLLETHNLILVGRPKSNRWLSKICAGLPVEIGGNQILAGGRHYEGRDMGFMVIYPNPLRPEKYAAVFSGTSATALSKMSEVYSQLKSMRPADVCVFEIAGEGTVRWHIAEKFNAMWDWHEEWNRVLASLKKKHAKWRWSQWAAKVLREQLGCDVVVCKGLSGFGDSISAGQITCRDLFNNFRNDWIVKVRLDGKNLRKMLLEKFKESTKNEADMLVVDGVSFVGRQGSQGDRTISELENDSKYIIACPEGVISGKGLGTALEAYEIVGEGYLALLLKDYLVKKAGLDIDAELDGVKLSIF